MSSLNEKTDSARPILPGPPPMRPSGANSIHPGFYIASSVILFNKYILDRLGFHFPIFLTTFHLAFATIITQLLARFTTLLDSRKKVPMNSQLYMKAIVPIGFFFSLSLICGNVAYLHLSVSFIQILKASTPVVVLLTSWALGTASPDYRVLVNVSIIVVGVMIASASEIQFVLIGFLFQVTGLAFEAIRIVLVSRLLSSEEYKMDPIVSLYYYAPACTAMNAVVFLFMEASTLSLSDIVAVGPFTLIANALVAFALNVSVVLLIGKTSSLVYTLSGVIKDILLVIASVTLFGDPVSGGQIFGYGIALLGLIYYKLGAQNVKDQLAEVHRMWGEYGIRHPIRRRLATTGIAFLVIIFFLRSFGVSNSFAPSKLSEIIGKVPQE